MSSTSVSLTSLSSELRSIEIESHPDWPLAVEVDAEVSDLIARLGLRIPLPGEVRLSPAEYSSFWNMRCLETIWLFIAGRISPERFEKEREDRHFTYIDIDKLLSLDPEWVLSTINFQLEPFGFQFS
jgi:hypothetical protein